MRLTVERPVVRGWVMQNSCIVVVREGEEANHVRWDQKTGYLMTYRRVEDMALNPPTGRVAMVILTGQDDPAGTQRALRWLRHRCPGCPITVVSRAGGVEHEMVARQGGAFYLTSGEARQHLPDMISHALRSDRETTPVFLSQLNGYAE